MSNSVTPPNSGTTSNNNGTSKTATTAVHAKNGHGRNGAAGAQAGGDLFSNLLSLLSATRDEAPSLSLGAEEPADPKAAKAKGKLLGAADENPLAGLMAWTGQPLPSASKGAAASSEAPAAATGQPDTTAATEGLELHGLTPLDAPTEPDAETLAVLARTAEAGTPPTGRALPAGAKAQIALASGGAPHPVAWNGGSAHSGAVGGASAVVNQTQALAESFQLRTGQLPAARSTVTLDERFIASTLAAYSAPDKLPDDSATARVDHGGALAAPGAGAGASDAGAGQAGAESGSAEHQEASAQADESADEANPYSGEADEPASEGMGHWSANNLRQASLSVGEGGEDAINIQLSMNGNEVSVDFKTDSAEARAGLHQSGASLSELLERSGIQLGGVSVGGQNAQQQGREASPQTTTGLGRLQQRGAAAQSATPSANLPPPRRGDGSQPLDLFV